MANECYNTLTISGDSEELERCLSWIRSHYEEGESGAEQRSKQVYETIYALEKEAEEADLPIGSGNASEAYGDATLTVWAGGLNLSWKSRWDPSLDAVVEMSKRFPELSFSLDFLEDGQELAGELVCTAGEAPELTVHSLDDSEDGSMDESWDDEDEE